MKPKHLSKLELHATCRYELYEETNLGVHACTVTSFDSFKAKVLC